MERILNTGRLRFSSEHFCYACRDDHEEVVISDTSTHAINVNNGLEQQFIARTLDMDPGVQSNR